LINIIYEDNHLLVVEKPINVLTQSDITGDKDLLTILKEDIKKRYNKPGNVFLGLIHRLDRPVGGVMVFAKTSKAASRLSEQIRLREFKKEYLAIIRGIPSARTNKLEHYIEKDRVKNIVRIVDNVNSINSVNNKSKKGKKAILKYEVLGNNKNPENMSLVKIDLITGRSHQIRVQFAEINHPLFGDQKYGNKLNKPGEQLALWSYIVEIEHPIKKEKMIFKCNPPKTYPWSVFAIKL
jgi:23S rRNA pseudouridine1911/1915/1917 synthase